ncbi:MAG: nucleotidyltransferase domain-containing protein [Nitrospira sp.]|nr:nucleotidyltransferase domain-containing protein [Nitrospira sp.]
MDDNRLIEYIRQAISNLVAFYRFGSWATGEARPDSDVDLAVFARDPIPNLRRFELAQELAIQLHRDVDLVDLHTASTVMRMQVISTGECLDAPDQSARREFEMYAYSDYARLNEERREILKRIRASDSMYTRSTTACTANILS